jgi:hypothetical protein
MTQEQEEERLQLQELIRGVGGMIQEAIEEARKRLGLERTITFAFVVADVGEPGSFAYAATVQREYAIRLLREVADFMEEGST